MKSSSISDTMVRIGKKASENPPFIWRFIGFLRPFLSLFYSPLKWVLAQKKLDKWAIWRFSQSPTIRTRLYEGRVKSEKKKIIDSGRKTLIKDASTSCMHFYDLIIGHFVGKIKSRSRSFWNLDRSFARWHGKYHFRITTLSSTDCETNFVCWA